MLYAGEDFEPLELDEDEDYQELVHVALGFGKAFKWLDEHKADVD